MKVRGAVIAWTIGTVALVMTTFHKANEDRENYKNK